MVKKREKIRWKGNYISMYFHLLTKLLQCFSEEHNRFARDCKRLPANVNVLRANAKFLGMQ